MSFATGKVQLLKLIHTFKNRVFLLICLVAGNAAVSQEEMRMVVHNPPVDFYHDMQVLASEDSRIELSQQWYDYRNANLVVFFLPDLQDNSIAALPKFAGELLVSAQSTLPGFVKYFERSFPDDRPVGFAFFVVSELPETIDLACASATYLAYLFPSERIEGEGQLLAPCVLPTNN